MICGKDFFDLQLRFAHRVVALSGLPLARALLDYTNLYARFGLGRGFDAAHPAWQAYLAGLAESLPQQQGWTHDFCRARLPEAGPPGVVARAGCFSYARLDGNRVRLHFGNAEHGARPPLGAHQQNQRLSELRALFAQMREREPMPPRVVGASWLYNLPAYRRLFPEAYLATAAPAGPRFRNMPLWGQLLDRHGALRPQVASLFLERLEAASSLEALAGCFPFEVLALEAPASVFYEFHRV